MGTIYYTDSGSDLPLSYYEQHQIRCLDLHFRFAGEDKDYTPQDMTIETFYQRLRAGEMASTSQANADDMERVFEKDIQAGNDIVYLAFSSGLSGTHNSGCIARDELKKKYPNSTILVVDTLCASLGQGLLVHLALQQRDAGKSAAEVAKWAEDNRLHIAHWVTLYDLQHLRRGGRISATAAFAGTMLSIKPIVHVDNEGHLINVGKAHGRKKALMTLIDHLEQTAINPSTQTVFISHSDALEDAQWVAQQIRERFHVEDFVISFIGPVIGSHTGPGTIALFFYATER